MHATLESSRQRLGGVIGEKTLFQARSHSHLLGRSPPDLNQSANQMIDDIACTRHKKAEGAHLPATAALELVAAGSLPVAVPAAALVTPATPEIVAVGA